MAILRNGLCIFQCNHLGRRYDSEKASMQAGQIPAQAVFSLRLIEGKRAYSGTDLKSHEPER